MTIFLQVWTAILYFTCPVGKRTYFNLVTNIRACVAGQVTLIAIFNGTLDRGVFTNIVTYPAVRRKECRLRVSVMNSLTREDMDRALALFGELGRKHGIVR